MSLTGMALSCSTNISASAALTTDTSPLCAAMFPGGSKQEDQEELLVQLVNTATQLTKRQRPCFVGNQQHG
eukprot:m.9621 g.9621  ORF g.9621 m.9621 type:complete len:71 (+) comp3562_c0_seq1:1272-1484(+)